MSPKSNMRGFHEINEELYKLSKNEDKAITHEDIKILYRNWTIVFGIQYYTQMMT